MIEYDRRLHLTRPEMIYAISSGGLLGVAIACYLFADIPPRLSIEIGLTAAILGFNGSNKVITREHEEWINRGRNKLEQTRYD